MKQSLAVFLLFAFVAQIYASQELDKYLMEESDDADSHPSVQCHKDLYDCIKKGAQSKDECRKAYFACLKQLIPTVPPFVIQCKDQLKSCVASASGFLAKGRCFLDFAKCLKNKGPSSPGTLFMDDVTPDRHPYVQCKIDLYDCIRLKKKDSLSCLKDYKNCMGVLIPTFPPLPNLPTIPPFVIACKDVLKSCVAGASGIFAKATCFRDFGLCLINKGPSPPALDAGEFILNVLEDEGPVPTRRPSVQCHVDFYNCVKAGTSKVQCAKDYRSCLVALIPSYVTKCRDEAKTCYQAASGWRAKTKCLTDFAKCIKNKGSS